MSFTTSNTGNQYVTSRNRKGYFKTPRSMEVVCLLVKNHIINGLISVFFLQDLKFQLKVCLDHSLIACQRLIFPESIIIYLKQRTR